MTAARLHHFACGHIMQSSCSVLGFRSQTPQTSGSTSQDSFLWMLCFFCFAVSRGLLINMHASWSCHGHAEIRAGKAFIRCAQAATFCPCLPDLLSVGAHAKHDQHCWSHCVELPCASLRAEQSFSSFRMDRSYFIYLFVSCTAYR